MKRVIRRISTAVYALGVLGALTFGASQAFGHAVQVSCRYQPPTWLGACTEGGNDECSARCALYGGEFGRCDLPGSPDCCVCFF